MLPDILAGSYQRYKADTNTFTTWLSKAAIALGYKAPEKRADPVPETPAQTKTNRRKGKARKVSREAERNDEENANPETIRHTITTRDLLEQAQVVAGRVEVPEKFRHVLRRAIEARQRCAEWFQTSNVKNGYSNEGHQHFISVLEQTLEIIGKGKETILPTKEKGKEKATIYQVDIDSDASFRELQNRFLKLAVEETPDTGEDGELPEDALNTTYELEGESVEMKMSLMIFCFFEDMHRIQGFLHGIWDAYKSGEVDLMTASLITNAAVGLVRGNEEEILAAAPKLFNRKRSYDTIAIVIFYAEAFGQGQDPKAQITSNEFLRPTPFDDFIYLSTAKALMKYSYIHSLPKKPFYPLPSMPLRAGFISRPDLLGTPYMDKKEQEDALLSQLMIDLDLFEDLAQGSRQGGVIQNPPPAEDELILGLRKLRREGSISVWLVFAARIFLDLQDILGKEIKRGQNDLKAVASNVDKVLKSTGVFSPTGSAICWLGKEDHVVRRLSELNHFWVLNFDFKTFRHMMWEDANISKPWWGWMMGNPSDGTSSASPSANHLTNHTERTDNKTATYTKGDRTKALQADLRGVELPAEPEFSNLKSKVFQFPAGYNGPLDQNSLRDMVIEDLGDGGEYINNPEYEENARSLKLRMIKPNKNPEFIVQHNPMYCGLIALNIVVTNEKAGLLLNNYHTVVTLVAHLYCESRRANMLALRWPEMDQMIDMHKDTMFPGKLPESANDAYIRFQKLMGLSTNPNRPASHTRGLPYKEPQYKTSSFSDAIRPFFERGPPFQPSLERLEAFVQKEREAVHHESKQKRRAKRRKLTPLQFLAQLKDFIPAQLSRLQFDYITLTKTCYMLMKKFHSEILRLQNVEYPLYTMRRGDSIQPLYPYMVLGILRTAKEAETASRGTSNETQEDLQMSTVASVLEKYLEVRARVAAAREATGRS